MSALGRPRRAGLVGLRTVDAPFVRGLPPWWECITPAFKSDTSTSSSATRSDKSLFWWDTARPGGVSESRAAYGATTHNGAGPVPPSLQAWHVASFPASDQPRAVQWLRCGCRPTPYQASLCRSVGDQRTKPQDHGCHGCNPRTHKPRHRPHASPTCAPSTRTPHPCVHHPHTPHAYTTQPTPRAPRTD